MTYVGILVYNIQIMITYNWKKIWEKSDGRATAIIDIINYLTYVDVPKNKHDPNMRFVHTDWSGPSFLIHPEPILEYRVKMYEKDLAEYVALASFRNLAEYKITKRSFLYLWESPIEPENFKNNKFLTIDNGAIHFRWEEATN